MKLWLLRPIKDWIPWYDKSFGFVIRAESEDAAREMADKNRENENAKNGNPWLDEQNQLVLR